MCLCATSSLQARKGSAVTASEKVDIGERLWPLERAASLDRKRRNGGNGGGAGNIPGRSWQYSSCGKSQHQRQSGAAVGWSGHTYLRAKAVVALSGTREAVYREAVSAEPWPAAWPSTGRWLDVKSSEVWKRHEGDSLRQICPEVGRGLTNRLLDAHPPSLPEPVPIDLRLANPTPVSSPHTWI